MKFAHLADTHLGFRQFGLIEREKDFYEVFGKVIDKIIEEKVDFVIHSGDLFENEMPSPMALLEFQKGLLKLKGAGIPMYAIAGNHDSAMGKGSIPPQVIFKKMGLKVISPINTNYRQGDVFIAGLPFYPSSQSGVLKSKLVELSKKAAKHEKSILVLHQAIEDFTDEQYELQAADIPDNFDYYALGHIHRYIAGDFGKGTLVYPGSTEIWKTEEIMDFHENGKGFVVVDLDGQKPIVKRVTVDLPREFIKRSIDFNNLESNIEGIKESIRGFDNLPILILDINNLESDATNINRRINQELGDLSLMIRPTFNNSDGKIDEIFVRNSPVGAKKLIGEKLEGYGNSDVNKLATDLYDFLSKDNLEAAQLIIEQYFTQHYSSVKDDVEFKTEEIEKEQMDTAIFENDVIEPMEDVSEDEMKDIKVIFKEGLE